MTISYYNEIETENRILINIFLIEDLNFLVLYPILELKFVF